MAKEAVEYEYVYVVGNSHDGVPGPGRYSPKPPSKAPSYTMRPTIVPAKAHPTPGPGAYESQHMGKDGQKSSLHSKLQPPQLLNDPGPGAYDHHPNFGRPDDAYSLKGRAKDMTPNTEVPGPGAYSPRSTLGDAHKHTLKSRMPEKQMNFNPGPGTYEQDEHMGRADKKTFGLKLESDRRQYKLNGRDKPPGPGAYDVAEHSDYIKQTKPVYTMRPQVPMLKDHTENPGPGTYDPRRLKAAPSHTCSPRFVPARAIHQPGPGAYELGHPMGKDGTKKSMHSKLHGPQRLDEPGPGAYDHHPNFGRPDDAYSFRKKTAIVGAPLSKNTPGPGAYTPRSTLGDAQQNALKGRTHRKYVEPTPGPGTYEALNAVGKGKHTTFKNYSGRTEKGYNGIPGPGAYAGMTNDARFFNKKTAAQFSFGASKTNRFGPGTRRVRVPKGTSGAQTARRPASTPVARSGLVTAR